MQAQATVCFTTLSVFFVLVAVIVLAAAMDSPPLVRPSASDAEAGMPRRSTQREPIRTPGRNFEENRALHGPVHVAKILGTPPDEPKPESEPVKSKTALHCEVPKPFRPPSPASCTGGPAPVGATQAEGLRSVQGVAEEVAGGDAPLAPLDAAAGPLGTELAVEVTP